MQNSSDLQTILSFGILFCINLVSIILFTYTLYYQRHQDKQGFVTYTLFNIFLFIIIYFLGHLQIGMSVGFAVFGILSLIRVRSDNFSKIDITYLIGALTIAITNALSGSSYGMIIVVNGIILIMTYIIDDPILFTKPLASIECTLDEIPKGLFTDKKGTMKHLKESLHVDVQDYIVENINVLKDSVTLTIKHRTDTRK